MAPKLEEGCNSKKATKGLQVYSCFECGEVGHFKNNCPWLDYPCVVKGCPNTMKIFTSKQPVSLGKRFLVCKTRPHECNGWIWEKDLVESKIKYEVNEGKCKEKQEESEVKEGKVTLNIQGKVPMSVEGNIEDITKMIKKLAM